MNKFHDMFFGPLNKDYCFLFYFFMVINFIAIAVVLMTIVLTIFTSKKIPVQLIASEMGFLVLTTIAYLQHRILHTMCTQTN